MGLTNQNWYQLQTMSTALQAQWSPWFTVLCPQWACDTLEGRDEVFIYVWNLAEYLD